MIQVSRYSGKDKQTFPIGASAWALWETQVWKWSRSQAATPTEEKRHLRYKKVSVKSFLLQCLVQIRALQFMGSHCYYRWLGSVWSWLLVPRLSCCNSPARQGDAQKGTPGLHLKVKCVCSFNATTLLFHVRPGFLHQPSMKAWKT